MKLNIIFILYFFDPEKIKKLFFLGLILRFSNLNVLHKGLLLQDWVFGLGGRYKSECRASPVMFIVGTEHK